MSVAPRDASAVDVDRFPRPAVPWWWEIVGWDTSRLWRWVIRNRVMRHDSGLTITYRPRRADDVLCNARTVDPLGEEMACVLVCDHAELPHVGAPARCVDRECDCGTFPLVVVAVSR